MRTALFALCLFLFACRNTSAIVDTDGEPVRNGGGAYYLVPVTDEHKGGLGLATVGNDVFPRTVILDGNLTNGLPVRFSAPERIAFIKSSLYVGISFVSSAPESASWIVESEFPIGWTVKVTTVSIWGGPFKVHPAKGGYKIVYYPERGSVGADLGLVHSGGYHRLAVKDGEPFIFKIKKATTESSARIRSVV